jgi:hypothetical protein
MSTVIRYGFKYDGARFYGSGAVKQIRALAANFGLLVNARETKWQQLISIFKRLPDYHKTLIVLREPRCIKRSRYKAMRRRGDVA